MENDKLKKFIKTTIREFLNENVNGRTIYHFTESLDSLLSILDSNTLESGSFNGRFGRGYENISFTWNPNLWGIEYVGDEDARYKVRIALDYQRMNQKYEFKPFDYGIPEEEEEIIETDEITPIIPYITEILISTEESMLETNNLKKRYPNLKIKRVKRRG
jgi:hypothetical protein